MHLNLLNLLLVLLAAWVGGRIAERLRYPSVLGELVAGMLLGPPLLGLLGGSEPVSVLAELGVLLMMLYIGMEIDPRELGAASWAGLLAAIGGFITPFAGGYLAVKWLGYSTEAALFIAIALAVTSLATKSRILVDLGILDTRIAHVLMAGALLSDTGALLAFAAVIGIIGTGSIQLVAIAGVAAKALAFFAVSAFLGIKVFPFVFGRVARMGLGTRTFNATLILLIALLFAELAELAGLHAILGAFLAGLFLREGIGLDRKISRQVNHLVHDMSIGFLAPIFFATAGFAVTFGVFRTDLVLLVTVFVVAILSKILGTALFYLPTGYGLREGITIGAGMNGRGAVEIIIAGIALEMGIISAEIFSILVFMAIFTTATVPFGLKWGVAWLRRHGELVRSRDERRGALFVGAGPVARKLAGELAATQPVYLVDINRQNCERAAAQGLDVRQGDALEQGVLGEAGATRVERLVAVTPNSEINVLSAQLARSDYLVPEAYAMLSRARGSALDALVKEAEALPLFPEPLEITDWDGWVARGEVEELEHTCREEADQEEVWRLLQRNEEVLPLVVVREDERLLFGAVKRLRAGDTIRALRRRLAPSS